jgi:hypothetical protein
MPKQSVFVVPIVGGEDVVMQHHHLNIIRAHLHEIRQLLLNRPDEVGFVALPTGNRVWVSRFWVACRKVISFVPPFR